MGYRTTRRQMAAKGPVSSQQAKFMRALISWDGVASARDLGPQTSQVENSARQTCKRRGWVTFEGGYWRLTETGMAAIHRTDMSTLA